MISFEHDKVHERFVKLPASVQDAILSEELVHSFANAMRTAGLSPEQMRQCNEQATLVLVGLSKTVEFESFATTELGLNEVDAHNFITAIKRDVFTPVRDALVQAVQEKQQSADVYREPVKK